MFYYKKSTRFYNDSDSLEDKAVFLQYLPDTSGVDVALIQDDVYYAYYTSAASITSSPFTSAALILKLSAGFSRI